MPRVADAKLRRAEIVTAAMSLVAAEGPEALSMRKIANHAGCTIGLLNHWFSNKDDLIEAILDTASSAAVSRAKIALAQPEVTLEDIAFEFLPLDATRREELRIWLVFWALSISRPALRKSYAKRVSIMREELYIEIERRGIVSKCITEFVDTLMTTLDGISVNALVDPDYWTADRQRKVIRWLLDTDNRVVC